MSPDEVNERAWQQMRAMHDNEIIIFVESHKLLWQETHMEEDIWDLRIAVRDYFFNELWREVNVSKI